jgi:Fanconi-associated nuclease 1
VEGFQKLKKYEAANDYLQFLLNQDVYLGNSYGRWYERLVLNSTHLKLPVAEVKGMIEKALGHPKVRDNHKLELSDRLSKLKIRERAKTKPKRKPKRKKPKRRTKKKDDDDWQESSDESEESSDSDFQPECLTVESDDDVDVSLSFRLRHTAPERTIEGEKMPMYDRVYGKSVFLDGDGSFAGGKSLSSVERFALQFYSQQGYTQGIHAEGAVPATIYGLLFWDVIYNDEIPDVFLSPYQAYPLDLFSEDFRSRRRSVIDERLGKMRSTWSFEDAVQVMQKHWIENCNKLSIVNWEIFSSFEHLKTLVSSMGIPLMAGICDRLADNYRYYRSGFPDLIAWNGHKCKIAEVKGPGDKLSAKQRLWIDYLLSLQADVEVCHVKSVSNKRIRS